jgi:hypothetical protein
VYGLPPGQFDAAALPDRAVRAAGGHQVAGTDGLLSASTTLCATTTRVTGIAVAVA